MHSARRIRAARLSRNTTRTAAGYSVFIISRKAAPQRKVNCRNKQGELAWE